MMEKRIPKKFRRQGWFRNKRLGEKWRKPRGEDSRMRVRARGKPPIVSIGYGSPAVSRGLHPSGFAEVLVHRPKDIEGLDPKKKAVRIAAGVGRKTREQIMAKAGELKIKVLNPVRKHEAEQKEKASG